MNVRVHIQHHLPQILLSGRFEIRARPLQFGDDENMVPPPPLRLLPLLLVLRVRVDIIGHLKSCMTDIYLHIDARMADYIRTHP